MEKKKTVKTKKTTVCEETGKAAKEKRKGRDKADPLAPGQTRTDEDGKAVKAEGRSGGGKKNVGSSNGRQPNGCEISHHKTKVTWCKDWRQQRRLDCPHHNGPEGWRAAEEGGHGSQGVQQRRVSTSLIRKIEESVDRGIEGSKDRTISCYFTDT